MAPASARKRLQFRQDRIKCDDVDCYIVIRNEKCKVAEFSQFGVTIQGSDGLNFISDFTGVPLFFGARSICDLDLFKLRAVTKGKVNLYTFEVSGLPIKSEILHSLIETQRVLTPFENAHKSHDWSKYGIEDNLRAYGKFLNELTALASPLSKLYDFLPAPEREECMVAMANHMSHFMTEFFEGFYSHMGKAARALSGNGFSEVLRGFRAIVAAVGYFGDLSQLKNRWRDMRFFRDGHDDVLVRALKYHFLVEPFEESEHVRERYLSEQLLGLYADSRAHSAQLLCLGAGSGHVIDSILSEGPSIQDGEFKFLVVDGDEQALKLLQKKLSHTRAKLRSAFQFDYIPKALSDLKRQGLDEGQFSFIFSFGLLDDFTDDDFLRVAANLVGSIGEYGKIVVSGMSTSGRNTFRHAFLLGLNKVFRTDADIEQLMNATGLDYTIVSDRARLNSFCVLRRKADRRLKDFLKRLEDGTGVFETKPEDQ